MTKNHKDDIKDWGAVETFCDAMAVMKKREADRKRNQKPERKEADRKRNQKPERKEVLKKADQKREPLRAQLPKRKEDMKVARMKYNVKIGDIRRRAQYRRYQAAKLDKES